jgi:hypothetical protein
VQRTAGGGAQPGNIAGIRRNFRLHQDDVKGALDRTRA